MDEVLGLLALAGYIVLIVGLAAAVTFVVVKIFPTERNPKKDDEPDKPAKAEKASSSKGDAPAEGSLFRRSKRDRSS